MSKKDFVDKLKLSKEDRFAADVLKMIDEPEELTQSLLSHCLRKRMDEPLLGGLVESMLQQKAAQWSQSGDDYYSPLNRS